MSNVPTPPTSQPSRPPRNNTGTVLIVVGVVIAVVIGFAAIGLLVGNSSNSDASSVGSTTTPTPTKPSTSPTPTTPSVTVTSPTKGVVLHCTTPPPLPKSPEQFTKVPSPSLAQNAIWRATLKTNCGTIVMDLNGKLAPQTVASFIFLSQQKFYDDTPCHRLVTQGIFVLQCGDPTGTGSGGPGPKYTYGLENTPKDGDYPTGTVAMARTSDPNSNASQFFIVYADTRLPAPGYSIFGSVVKGLPIVQAIAAKGIAANGVSPTQPISIISSTLQKL